MGRRDSLDIASGSTANFFCILYPNCIIASSRRGRRPHRGKAYCQTLIHQISSISSPALEAFAFVVPLLFRVSMLRDKTLVNAII
jgi:hypothetical protein